MQKLGSVSLALMAMAVGHGRLFPQDAGSERPYVATVKRTVIVRGPGDAEIVKSVETRTEARDRYGRRYTSPGSESAGPFRIALLHDVVAGKVYQIDHANKRAFINAAGETRRGPNLSSLTPAQREEVQSRMTTVRGVPCLYTPVHTMGEDGNRRETGSGCMSFELGLLTVFQDYWVSYAGESRRMVTELVDLKMDTEPNPDWFQIPEGYTVTQGAAWQERAARNP